MENFKNPATNQSDCGRLSTQRFENDDAKVPGISPIHVQYCNMVVFSIYFSIYILVLNFSGFTPQVQYDSTVQVSDIFNFFPLIACFIY